MDARMARDKTCPNASATFNSALFRAVIKHFKAEWDAQERAATRADERSRASQQEPGDARL